MVELEYNNHRYMVENGQWFRRLEVGNYSGSQSEVFDSHEGWVPSAFFGQVQADWRADYRVPCTDPRPPFVVGQRVKVARKPGDDCYNQLFGQCGVVNGVDATDRVDCGFDHIGEHVTLPSWCLDAVTEVAE